ncbi:MAG: OmpH family outer membrane protein [Chitinophagales bacterium]
MKKLKVLAIAVCLVVTGSAIAQSKFGYINMENIVQLMPGTAKLDSLLERYQVDTIQSEYASVVEQYQFNDSLYRDSTKTPPSVRAEIAKKLPGLIYQIQNWQQISQQAMEAKQSQLLSPIYKEVYDAIKVVAKEKGYTHVFNREAFLVAPEGDDLIVAVATKLKVKVPPQLMPGYKPPAGPTGIK